MTTPPFTVMTGKELKERISEIDDDLIVRVWFEFLVMGDEKRAARIKALTDTEFLFLYGNSEFYDVEELAPGRFDFNAAVERWRDHGQQLHDLDLAELAAALDNFGGFPLALAAFYKSLAAIDWDRIARQIKQAAEAMKTPPPRWALSEEQSCLDCLPEGWREEEENDQS